MSDQGLSIFDEPDGEAVDEQPTQVLKAQGGPDAAPKPTQAKPKPPKQAAAKTDATPGCPG